MLRIIEYFAKSLKVSNYRYPLLGIYGIIVFLKPLHGRKSRGTWALEAPL